MCYSVSCVFLVNEHDADDNDNGDELTMTQLTWNSDS